MLGWHRIITGEILLLFLLKGECRVIKTIRLQIIKPYNTNEQDLVTWEELGKELNLLRSSSARMLNYVLQKKCFMALEYQEYKRNVEIPMSFKDFYNMQEGESIYKQVRSRYPDIAPCNVSATIQFADKYWKRYLKDIKTLDMSIPSFNKNAPVIVRAADYKILCNDNDYIIDAPLLSSDKPRYRYQFIIKQGDKSKAAILHRLLSGEYKKGDMKIIRSKNKWFCLIPYKFTVEEKELDKNKILGVDMGITNAVYWAISGSPQRGHIPGGEIVEYRKRVHARRISIQNQSKYSGGGRSGHGTNRKLKPIKVLSEKENNFRNTINHRYSKVIVAAAIKNNCGTIQLEDLSGISTKNKFLKDWPYYDLREKIEYKAKEQGIEIKIVDPKYTSQRCSECGYIAKENRDRSKPGFECVVCGYGKKYTCKDCGNTGQKKNCEKCGSANTYKQFVHADYNAARNLAIPDIDIIIKNTREPIVV